MISCLSDYFELQASDIIMPGTPPGVGPVLKGGTVDAMIEGLGGLTVRVV